jgi:hypothetical protein
MKQGQIRRRSDRGQNARLVPNIVEVPTNAAPPEEMLACPDRISNPPDMDFRCRMRNAYLAGPQEFQAFLREEREREN